MIKAILADTGPLYALADPSDQYHQRASRELEQILERDLRIAVPYPVLCECYTLILRRLGGAYSRQWLDELVEGSVPVNPEPVDYLAAATMLNRFPDQAITLTDAVTAVSAERMRLAVWSYDRHFLLMGAQTLGQPAKAKHPARKK